MNLYLDNAATTQLDPEVFEAMEPFLKSNFGNPSSTHAHGRIAKSAVETSRNTIAELLNCSPGELFFNSGGTEGNNTILRGVVSTFNVDHAISSVTEHHAVLHTLDDLKKSKNLKISFLNVDKQGHIDLTELEQILKTASNTLVSIMHANNEIGTMTDLERIAELCNEYDAIFHSDTVQSMAHYKHDLAKLNISSIVASAHKFHGPKGTGFMYINKKKRIQPFIHGGPQEREMRAGTENVAGIVGIAKALEIAHRDMEHNTAHISELKKMMIERLKTSIPGVSFSGDLSMSLSKVLNVSLPVSDAGDLILVNLDLAGISASGGSACAAGAVSSSHVLDALGVDPQRAAVRFSFSKFNTEDDIIKATDILAKHYH